MSALIDVMQPGDVVWTMNRGTLRAWVVCDDGTLVEADPAAELPR